MVLKNTVPKLQNSGINHYFKNMITSEQAGIMKPHAAIYEYAMNKAGTTSLSKHHGGRHT